MAAPLVTAQQLQRTGEVGGASFFIISGTGNMSTNTEISAQPLVAPAFSLKTTQNLFTNPHLISMGTMKEVNYLKAKWLFDSYLTTEVHYGKSPLYSRKQAVSFNTVCKKLKP
jgi:hypothetical protein